MEKALPTQEIINEYVKHVEDMHEALQRNDFDMANDFIAKMGELNEKYNFFDQEFTENGLTGVKDITGKVRIPALYKAIGATYRYDHWRDLPIPVANEEDKFAIVKADGTGEPLCEFEWDFIESIPWTTLFLAHRDHKATILRPNGTRLINTMVDHIYEPFNDIIMLENEGKFGLCTFDGDYVEPIYDEMGPDENDDVYARIGDTWGYISYEGEFLPEPLSDEDYDKGHYNFRVNI